MNVDDIYGQPQGKITFTKEEFGDQLWNKVGETLSILTKAGYMAKVFDDEPAMGIVVIEFGYKNEEWGPELLWVDTDKYYFQEWNNDNSDRIDIVDRSGKES